MTQLIAAICEGGAKVVTASERAVGSPGITPVYMETESKTHIVGDSSLAMFAGSATNSRVIADIADDLKKKRSVGQVAEAIRRNYAEVRAVEAAQHYLPTLAGVHKLGQWHQQVKTSKHAQQFVQDVNSKLAGFLFKAEVVIAGVDAKPEVGKLAGRVFYVGADGVAPGVMDEASLREPWVVAGSGYRLAYYTFRRWGHCATYGEDRTLHLVYESIRAAKAESGVVGGGIDMYVISSAGIRELSCVEVDALAQAYDARAGASWPTQERPPTSADGKE